MKRSSPKKSFLPRLMALAGLAGLLLLPQATGADLWVIDSGVQANCYRGAAPPSPSTATCSDLNVAASSSTSGETINCAGIFTSGVGVPPFMLYGLHLKYAGNHNTTWTNWPGNSWTVNGTPNGLNTGIRIGDPMGTSPTNVTINYVSVTGASAGIDIQPGVTGSTVVSSNIHDNGTGVLVNGPTSEIIRNDIYSNTVDGVQFGGWPARKSRVGRNLVYQNGGNGGINISSATEVLIDNNLLHDNSGYDVSLSGADTINIIENTFYGQSAGSPQVMVGSFPADSARNINILNNIFEINGSATTGAVYVANTSISNLNSNNNDMWAGGGANISQWGAQAASDLAQWQALSSEDGASQNADPDFGANKTLNSGSPAVNAGQDVSGYGFGMYDLGIDYFGDARPADGGWDQGYDERDDGPGPIPEFSILTLVIALLGGMGLILLVSRVNKKQQAIG